MLFRILGLLLGLFSLTMLPPMLVDLYYQESSTQPFAFAMAVTAVLGLILWVPFRKAKGELRARHGFIIVVLFWVVLSLFGALPFLVSDVPIMTLTDAIFESVSGITTTGATVLTGLDEMPKALLFYRQQLQLLGAMGIIILAVAILPMLGVGGIQLFKAESTGPLRDKRLTPRITETAKALWGIYLTLTLMCILSFYFAGMGFFNAICYGFSTMATGGFAPHDASLGFFHQPSFLVISMLFMFLSAISFPLHFACINRLTLRPYWQDHELKFFFGIIISSAALIFLCLFFSAGHHSYLDALFHVVSFSTTTGLLVSEHHILPAMTPFLLLCLGVIGGCAGSTTGGIKVIRFILLQKQGGREIKRLIHPQGRFAILFQGKSVSAKAIEAIWGFLALYVALFALFLLLLLIVEPDFVTAYTAVIACFSNIGPALGGAADNYSNLHDFSKWVLCFAMLIGRLEMFTVLVLLSPVFWRH